MSVIAITRAVSRALEHCELTHLQRREIDVDLAREQHAAYEQALRDAGCEVQQLEELSDFPDSVFVEDTVIVLGDIAYRGADAARCAIATWRNRFDGVRIGAVSQADADCGTGPAGWW